MGYPSPVAKQQFFNDAGVILAGGLLYTYAAGTTTPLAIYSDSGLTTPHANPAVLDAAGRISLFMADGVSYKFTLKDSAGNTIWTVDGVSIPAVETPITPDAVPPGVIVHYGAASAPTGYLLCDGSAVSRTTYSALFAIVGTTFGVGDGATTFNVPDVRQRFMIGLAAAGTASTLAGTGGTIDHVHTGPSHTHTYTTVLNHTHTVNVNDPGHAHVEKIIATSGGGSDYPEEITGGATTKNSGASTDTATTGITATTNNPAGGAASGTTAAGGTGNTGSANPPFIALPVIVKV